MNKRQYISLACILIFFGLAAGMEFFLTKDWNLTNYERRIEQNLQENEKEVAAILDDKSYLKRQFFSKEGMNPELQKLDLLQLENLTTQLYNISLYRDDSLIFWTNNQAFLSKKKLRSLPEDQTEIGFVQLTNGAYEYIYQPYPEICENCAGVGLIPIKYDFSLKSRYLQNTFVTENFSIPKEVSIAKEPNAYGIESISGKTLTWIDADKGIKDKTQLKILLMVYLLGFIAMAVLVNDLAIALVKRFAPWAGAAFLIATIFLLRYLTLQFGFSANFSDLHTFSDTFRTPVLNSSSSLGDLLINIVLLLWMMVFFHHQFQVNKFKQVPTSLRYGLSIVYHLSIILGILMITGVFKSLVLDSDITFDFDNVFNLNFYSFLSIVGVILLLFALFLFSHRMMTSIAQIGLKRKQRYLSLAVALGISSFMLNFMNLQMETWILVLISFGYLIIFDLFIDVKAPNLSWLVGWVVIFAVFSTVLLFMYNVDKDYQLRAHYAMELASYRDTLAEGKFNNLRSDLQENSFLKSLTRAPFTVPKEDLENSIDLNSSKVEYLYHNYIYDISAFYKESKKNLIEGNLDSLDFFQNQFYAAQRLDSTGIRYKITDNFKTKYYLKTEIEGANPIVCFLEFERKKSSPSKVYSELLIGHQFKDLDQLSNYDYAIYQDGVLIEEDGGNDYEQTLSDVDLPPVGEVLSTVSTSIRWELLYHGADNKVVKIGRNVGGYIKPISLFSYLFGLLIVTVILLSILNAFTNALPNVLNFSISKKLTLRNRIQFAVISVIIVSFVFIGATSVSHFQDQSIKYHSGRLDRKARAAKTSAQRELNLLYQKNQLKVNLIDLIAPTSTIHRLDVNLFDTLGNLISSSEKNIFQKGIITPKMGAFAFFSSPSEGNDIIVQDESVGDLKYKAAYIPLTNPQGEKVAFLGLPYYSQERDLRGDVTEFIGELMNVYVFLLLIAGAIAIFVANSITQPISDIGDSMKRVKLGKNEPLEWKNDDELGELIRQYNLMIQKLDESTQMLTKAEREGAWREMAKQVAHEIKNPLTPMKLSIQYMLHAYQSNPDNIAPLMKRVSKTLIEQIDSLTQIANDFSNFAKMPIAESSKFLLNDLAVNVHGLFGNESQEMDVSLYLPDKNYFVYADKKHLTRVLNNLIKNAIQAIPDERKGKIDVRLYEEGNMVVIQVQDNGTGITDEMKEKVFVPNFTTKNSGTGLGLAISKNIMDSFQGNIYFETEVGVGTSFFIELPIVEVEELERI